MQTPDINCLGKDGGSFKGNPRLRPMAILISSLLRGGMHIDFGKTNIHSLLWAAVTTTILVLSNCDNAAISTECYRSWEGSIPRGVHHKFFKNLCECLGVSISYHNVQAVVTSLSKPIEQLAKDWVLEIWTLPEQLPKRLGVQITEHI